MAYAPDQVVATGMADADDGVIAPPSLVRGYRRRRKIDDDD